VTISLALNFLFLLLFFVVWFTGGFMKRAIQGTLEYMAPEVLLKKPASSASDVYALAIAISELATGALTSSVLLIMFSDALLNDADIGVAC
jgi:serine/threonine protein kinase